MPTTPDDRNAPIMNALPWVVWLWLAAILGVEALLSAGAAGLIGGAQAVGWRIAGFEDFAFSSALQVWMFDTWQFPMRALQRYVTYPFVHGSPFHAVLASVLIAALGKAVTDAMGTRAFVVLMVPVPALAAVAFGLAVGRDDLGWLFGAMVPVFALVGAFTWLSWHRAAGDPAKQRRAFSLIALLLIARLGFGVMAETGPAWVAEIAAFALSFGLSALVLGPGQWARTRARLRQRD